MTERHKMTKQCKKENCYILSETSIWWGFHNYPKLQKWSFSFAACKTQYNNHDCDFVSVTKLRMTSPKERLMMWPLWTLMIFLIWRALQLNIWKCSDISIISFLKYNIINSKCISHEIWMRIWWVSCWRASFL